MIVTNILFHASLFYYFRMHHWIPSCGNASRIYSLTVILKVVSQHNRGIHEQRVKSRSLNKFSINYCCIPFLYLSSILLHWTIWGGGILTMVDRNRVALLLGLILSVCIEFNIEFARAAAAVHAWAKPPLMACDWRADYSVGDWPL